MNDIHIDTLRICQESSASACENYQQFYIRNENSHAPGGIFLMRNQKHGYANDNIYYKTLDEAIETAMIFVKNKYQKPKFHYRVTLEISSDKQILSPDQWGWYKLLNLNYKCGDDKIEVIDCKKLS